MHKVFKEVNTLDNICYNKYYLSEEILMENASIGMHNLIDNLNQKNQFKKILIVCGVGNNGADGLALARRLFKDFEVDIFLPMDVKTNMANFQLKIVNALGINIISNITLLENKYDF
jgi:NAD(P)H-hydrate repair Nnr-like enzyme with NAD(P)H-hydrate epimerase domain